MKKKFLESWKGSSCYGQQEKWQRADGSSLNEEEVKNLKNGGVITHPKRGINLTKIFVMDESESIWSVIVLNTKLSEIRTSLRQVGFAA